MKKLYALVMSGMLLAQSGLCAQDLKPEGYTCVVGYTYDFTQDRSGRGIIQKDGSIHDGVIRATTIRLDQREVLALLKLLKERQPPGEGEAEFEEMECHDPHHAFVFYDDGWKPVAWINICFLCFNTSTNTRGAHSLIDLEPLERFCKNLGMPVFQDASEYTKLYKAEQGGGGAAEPSS